MKRTVKRIFLIALIIAAVSLGTIWAIDYFSYNPYPVIYEAGKDVVEDVTESGKDVIAHRSVDSVRNEIDEYFINQTGKSYYQEVARVWPPHDTCRQLDETLRDIDSLARRQTGYGWLGLYQRNVFDCSEMSACLEYILENKGFTTDIACGKTPKGNHAWIVVSNNRGDEYIVESTALCRVTSPLITLSDVVAEALGVESLSLEYYQSPKDLYHIVYEAEYDYLNEFDWWESCPISLDKLLSLLPTPTPTPVSSPTPTPSPTPSAKVFGQMLFSGEITLDTHDYYDIPFSVDTNRMHDVHVDCLFQTSGKITVFIMSDTQFASWSRNTWGKAYAIHDSESIAGGRLTIPITESGIYHLVFSNALSILWTEDVNVSYAKLCWNEFQ